jgi:hypothetical protein
MPVKDLYYQKYLKYKTKYLNLLSQTGGAPSPIFITEKGDTITINNEAIKESRPFSVEELQNSNIETTTIKLENLIENKHIFHILRDQAQAFPNIKKLIFDGNDLSTHANVDLIVSIIRLFENVSHLSFNNCRLDNITCENLLKKLNALKQIFTDIILEDNKLSPFIKTLANSVKNKPPVSQQRADNVRQITDEMEKVLEPLRAVKAKEVEELVAKEKAIEAKKLEFQANLRVLDTADEIPPSQSFQELKNFYMGLNKK